RRAWRRLLLELGTWQGACVGISFTLARATADWARLPRDAVGEGFRAFCPESDFGVCDARFRRRPCRHEYGCRRGIDLLAAGRERCGVGKALCRLVAGPRRDP